MTWPLVRLSDVLDTSIGGVWGKPPGEDDVEVRVWRVTELKTGGRLFPATAASRSVSAKQFESRALQTGDLLLEKSGGGPAMPVGRVGLVTAVPEPAICSNFMQLLRPCTAKVEPRYLHLYLNHFHTVGGTLRFQTSSTNIRNIKASDYVSMTFPLPPQDEQRRVVELLEYHLSRLDAADKELARAADKLDALWRSTLTATRHSSSAERRAIGEIANTSLGKMLDAKRQTGEPTPYLRNINVRWGSFDVADLQTTPLAPGEVERFDVREGDIMLCEGGEPGRCAVWRGGRSGIAFQKALHRIRVRNEEEVLPDFLALMLEEYIRSGRADRLFTGTTIKHLPQEKLRTIEIGVPSLYEQQAALRRLSAVAESSGRLRSSLVSARRRSRALRRSLLAAAFSGRLTEATYDLSGVEEMIGA